MAVLKRRAGKSFRRACVWIVLFILSSCGSESAAPPGSAAAEGAGEASNEAPQAGEEPGSSAGEGASEDDTVTAPLLPVDAPAEGAPGEEPISFDVPVDPATEVEEVLCAAQAAATELQRANLAFALDVSASMWQGDQRFAAKWQPIVGAAQAFFAEPDAIALSASLTFFPSRTPAECDEAAYFTPDVPLTTLPSPAFAEAIGALAVTASTPGNGFFSSPTLAAFKGAAASLAADPSTQSSLQAVVLVTDGVPQSCPNVDVAAVAEAVQSSGVRTFVIGVGNPPGLDGGDNLDNLNVIAEAGGTERAFIVQTGDPVQTQAEFKAIIDDIRRVSVSCTIEIPLPPAGSAFIPEFVNVTYGSEGAEDIELEYDPECASDRGWRYDDPAAPATIQLCGDACSTIQRDLRASLDVEFGCERRGVPR